MKVIPYMRRFICAIFAVLAVFGCSACTSELSMSVGDIPLRSRSAFIYDMNSKETKFSDDARIYPASTTKLLTALTALELMDPELEVSPGEEVYMTGEGASSAYIRPGQTLTLEMLIEAMIVPSGNDAAYAVAAAGGRVLLSDGSADAEKSVFRFVDEMNRYAEKLGCKNTNFTTPDGLAGEDHYSTSSDMAKIAAAAAENNIIMKYAATASDDVTYASGHTNTWINTNKQLDKSSPYYNANIKGMKTGSLDGYYCLISLYDDGENKYIIGTFGASDDAGRYKDTENILKSILNQ